MNIVEIPAVVFLGFWFLMQLLSGVGSLAACGPAPSDGIAFWAHIAGFAFGAGLVKLLAPPQPPGVWDAPGEGRGALDEGRGRWECQ